MSHPATFVLLLILFCSGGEGEFRTVTIRALAVESEKPVAGARVTVSMVESPHESEAVAREVWTDAQGIVRIGALRGVRLRAYIHHPDFASDRLGYEIPAGADSLTVRLARGRVLAGRVRIKDGRPAPGAEVTVRDGTGQAVAIVFSGPDGAFRVGGLSAAEHDLCAFLLTEERDFRGTARAVPGGRMLTLTLTEWPRPALTVRVVGPDGKPVPKFGVTFHHQSLRGRLCSGGEATGGVWRGEFHRAEDHQAYLAIFDPRDAEGRPLPFGPVQAGPFDLTEPLVTLRLPPEKRITGTVRDRAGNPVVGTRVAAVPLGWLTSWRNIDGPEHGTATTGADGRFAVGRLGDGRYLLYVEPPPELLSLDAIRCRAGDRDLTVEVPPAACPVVKVLDPDRLPVEGAKVSAFDFFRARERPTYGDEVVTDIKGQAHLRGLHPGREYCLSVAPPEGRDHLAFGMDMRWKPVDCRIVLTKRPADPPPPVKPERGLTITLRLLNPPAGRSVHTNTHPERTGAGAAVGKDGIVTVHGATAERPVTLLLRTYPAGYTWLGRGLFPGAAPETVRLASGRTITGVVRPCSGRQLPGVAAESAEGFWFRGRVEKDGRFVIRSLPDGVYTVQASFGPDGGTATAQVPAGASVVLTSPPE